MPPYTLEKSKYFAAYKRLQCTDKGKRYSPYEWGIAPGPKIGSSKKSTPRRKASKWARVSYPF